ncbi:MAG: hypothetical protein ABIG61_04655 [Planctomycetota bacterium]
MKEGKKYGQRLNKVCRSLRRKHGKVEKVAFEEPVEALVYGTLCEQDSESAADSAFRKIKSHFVDLNDLRVSRNEEITEIIGQDNEVGRALAERLRTSLNRVFNEYDMITLGALKEMGKRQAKQCLEKMESAGRFVVNYVMLTSFGGRAIPLTGKMLQYLQTNELVHPEANEQEIDAFLEHYISASDTYKFYALLRRESESRDSSKKVRVRAEKVKKDASKKTKKSGKAEKKTG